MARFLSKASGYRLTVNIKGQPYTARFQNGSLDTEQEAERLRVEEKDLLAALRSAKSQGTRFAEVVDPKPPKTQKTKGGKGGSGTNPTANPNAPGGDE